MKMYVVCEDYTCAFCGLFVNKNDAKKEAQEIGGSVIVYDTNKIDNSNKCVEIQ